METGTHVNCMERASPDLNSFRWPASEDILFYEDDNILCTINPPSPVNRRGHYCLLDDDYMEANTLLANHK